MIRRAFLAVLLLAASRGLAAAQPAGAQVTIGGQVAQPTSYTIQALASLPALEVRAAREGGQAATYVGTPLWPLITAAQPVDAPGRGARLLHVLYVRGADGYTVALALAEIDPQFEGKPVLIAYKQDGALLAAPRLVVPGDHRAGRNVRDLVAIDVR